MGFHAMGMFLHVCANGHTVLSMNHGSFLNGKHRLTPLTRPSLWVLLKFLNMFPQGIAILLPINLICRKLAPFRMTFSSILDLMMKSMPSLLRSNMNFSNIGPTSLGDAEVQEQPLLREQMAVSSPLTQQAHLVLPLQGRDAAMLLPGARHKFHGNGVSGRSLFKKGDLTRMEMMPRSFFFLHIIWIMCDIGTTIKHDRCGSPLILTTGRMILGLCGKTTLTLISVLLCILFNHNLRPSPVEAILARWLYIRTLMNHKLPASFRQSSFLIRIPECRSRHTQSSLSCLLSELFNLEELMIYVLFVNKLVMMFVLFTLDFALFRVMNQSKPMMDLASPSEFLPQWALKRTSTTLLFEFKINRPKGICMTGMEEVTIMNSLKGRILLLEQTYIHSQKMWRPSWPDHFQVLQFDRTVPEDPLHPRALHVPAPLAWMKREEQLFTAWMDAQSTSMHLGMTLTSFGMFAHKLWPLRKGISCESSMLTIDLMTLLKKNSNVFFYWNDRKSPLSAFFVCASRMWIMLLIDVVRERSFLANPPWFLAEATEPQSFDLLVSKVIVFMSRGDAMCGSMATSSLTRSMSLSSTMETMSALTFRLILRNLSSCAMRPQMIWKMFPKTTAMNQHRIMRIWAPCKSA